VRHPYRGSWQGRIETSAGIHKHFLGAEIRGPGGENGFLHKIEFFPEMGFSLLAVPASSSIGT
jgi:hypothetical protein